MTVTDVPGELGDRLGVLTREGDELDVEVELELELELSNLGERLKRPVGDAG